MAFKVNWWDILGPFDRFFENTRKKWRRWRGHHLRPLHIEPFRGFTNGEQVFFQGRLMEYKPLFDQWKSDWRKNLVNSVRRFASEEVPHARVDVQLDVHQFPLTTDKEGYFILDAPLPRPVERNGYEWLQAEVHLRQVPDRQATPFSKVGQLMHPHPATRLGIITDIDDTLLHTGVTSPLKWRVFYLTFLTNISSRKPVEASGQFYRSWYRSDQTRKPVFYVSNSPWNLYDLLRDFLRFNGFPKGPILLRDVGFPSRTYPGDFPSHKEYTIARILQIYPSMRFVLIGDSGEKDAKIYLHIAQRFPDQIAAILIRKVTHGKRSARVQQLLSRKAAHIPNLLFNEFSELPAFLAKHDLQ